MSQTKKGSLAEAFVNSAAGWLINFACNLIILPYFGFTTITPAKALGIGVVFTFISIARSYVLRRAFNAFRWGNAT